MATTTRVDHPNLAQNGTASSGQTASALQTSGSLPWTLTLQADTPANAFGHARRLGFHPATITLPSSPAFRTTARPGNALDVLGAGWVDLSRPEWQTVELPLSLFGPTDHGATALAQGPRPAGIYRLQWDGTDDRGQALASAVYLYRLRVGDREEARKLLLPQ